MMWHPRTERPEAGKRIVALLNDGSGAQLFWVHDDGLMSNDGDEAQALGKDFDQWAYLPDGFRTWIEDNLD